jgi:UDP-N-acetylglucosamine--N-acetylmuramyl-(pentapeptide) pyrophosphoryl-undecaprenol N-acetylglucosamine transferase
MSRVVISGGGTGGHLMPALALAEAFADARPGLEAVLVGAERGVEASILPQRGVPHHLVPAEPLYRDRWWRNLRWPFLVPRLLRACERVLDATQPALVVGTGGYAAGPVLFTAWRRGIPVALQEQNAHPGVTTRWAARWARQVHLGFPEAQEHLRIGAATEVFVLGNPITPPGAVTRAQARAELGIAGDQPAVLVMGGSQGARAINAVLARVLDSERLAFASVLWSTGRGSFDAYARYHHPPRVQVRAFWDPLATAYAAVDLVVSRAGAMTVAELAAWGLPCVLVPLPTAAADHQTFNAAAVAGAGAGVHVPESALTAERLTEAVTGLLADADGRRRMADAARARARPDAARAIVERLLSLM